MPAGRPSKHEGRKTNKLVYRLSLLGLTDKEMAGVLEIDVSTLQDWKKDHPQFTDAIKKGKDNADSNVVKSLYKRANGYDYTETKIEKGTNSKGTVNSITTTRKHVPPDVGAIAFWLKNRRGKKWNDRIPDDNGGDDKPILENGEELPKDEEQPSREPEPPT